MKTLCTSCKHKDACDRDRRIIGYPNFKVTECVEYEPTHANSRSTHERELISRADALKALDRLCERFEAEIADAKDNPENYTDNFIVGMEEQVAGIAHAYHEVYDIPSADAVEVVRCKDCRWFDKGDNEVSTWSACTRTMGIKDIVTDTDYCSFVERREESEVAE